MSRPLDLDNLESDLWHLYHQIDAVVDIMQGLDHRRPEPTAITEQDRADALAWIARDLAERIAKSVSDRTIAQPTRATPIEAHAETFRLLDAACDAADNAVGSKAKAEAEAAKAAASDATADAIDAIIQYPYSSLAELGEGIRYLVGHYQTTGDGDPQAWLERLAYAVAGLDENGGAS